MYNADGILIAFADSMFCNLRLHLKYNLTLRHANVYARRGMIENKWGPSTLALLESLELVTTTCSPYTIMEFLADRR